MSTSEGEQRDDPAEANPARTRELAQLYDATSSVLEALVRNRDPARLHEEACRVAVEKRLALLAWVGMLAADGDLIVPVARWGRDEGYVDSLSLRLSDPRTNRGPACRALLTGAPAVVDDFTEDPTFTWRDEAVRRGLRSCAIFPLRRDGAPVGVFAIYGDRSGYFRDEELRVLAALADNLSFAVEAARAQLERERLLAEVTERTAQVERWQRLYGALSQVNQAIVRKPPEGELLDRVARALVEAGGFSMAWIGELDPATREISPRARRGDSEGYVASIRVFADERPEGRGPTGTAVREDRIVICDDFAADPSTVPWREAAERSGWRASACFPVHRGGRVWGAISVYARERGFFGDRECALLLEVADDLSFALDALDREARQHALEAQVRQAHKMEAIGRLAGGVAHDFNNLLTVILGYVSMTLEELPADSPVRPDLSEVHVAAERATELTRQLLAFGRQQVLEPRVVDLNRILQGMSKMLGRLVGDAVRIGFHPAPRLGQVRADPAQIEQIVLNLVVNARDAMPDGGQVTIETANVTLEGPDDEPPPGGLRTRDCVSLIVSDTGTGIDPAVREQIFEPFFTTKEPGRGTGLGLATVDGIVAQSGGLVRVESQPGRGSTFRVLLPRVDAPAEVAPPQTQPPPTLRGREIVLVVEDQPQVRGLVSAVLRRAGYQVHEADNGGEALVLAERLGDRLDLLLTDVVMRHLGGPELARRLRAVRPDLRVLFVSGQPPSDLALGPGDHLLAKPLLPTPLLRRVRELLDAPAAGPP